jgi:hypothetical protein
MLGIWELSFTFEILDLPGEQVRNMAAASKQESIVCFMPEVL